MSYKTYTSEFKAKVVIEVLQGEKSLSEIASQYNLNPNMVRNWKSEFLENASMI
ncbi:MAG: transposase, partial [Ruminococcus sp.]|nr:transposase [Ruminococcus sp.]